MSQTILFTKQNNYAKITLNRPKAFNSFNQEMGEAFLEALDDCASDHQVRAVLITGEGRAFCAGQDLVEVTDPELNPGFRNLLEKRYGAIIRKMRNLEKPVICAVNGVAAGAGANIALAGDIVVAHEKASFLQAFSAIGLIPDSAGTFFLPRLVGFQKGLALAMMGDKVPAAEAERMGMIYKVLPLETFQEETEKLASKIASMPTKGLVYTKKAFNASLHQNLNEQLDLETEYQLACFDTEDYKEGVAAFLEKRKPVFKGK